MFSHVTHIKLKLFLFRQSKTTKTSGVWHNVLWQTERMFKSKQSHSNLCWNVSKVLRFISVEVYVHNIYLWDAKCIKARYKPSSHWDMSKNNKLISSHKTGCKEFIFGHLLWLIFQRNIKGTRKTRRKICCFNI